MCPGILFQSNATLAFSFLFTFCSLSLLRSHSSSSFPPSGLSLFCSHCLLPFLSLCVLIFPLTSPSPSILSSHPLSPALLPSFPSFSLPPFFSPFLRFFSLPSLPPLPLSLPFSRPEIYYPFDERSQQRYSGSAAALAFSLTPEPLTFLSAVCLRPDPSPLCLRLHPSFPRREEA